MNTRFLPQLAPAWSRLLAVICLGGALSAPAATLSDFGFGNMATGSSRPMLVILAVFSSPTFPDGANITTYSNRVFSLNPGAWTVNAYFQEVSNDRFQWTPTRVLRVDMPESGRYTNFNDDSAYASNIIYCAVATNAFNWDVYGQPGETKVTSRDLAISLFSNDGGKSARSVWGLKPPGVTRSYEGLVYVGDPNESVDLGCHEMSHILGAIDFYGIWGIGGCLNDWLTLMSCTHNAKYHLDAWHKMQFGWSEPRIFPLNSGGTTTLNAAQLETVSAPIILYDTNRGPDEFFLLEYRTRNVTGLGGGYDANVYDNGLVIWHVAHKPNKMPGVMAEIAWPDAERLWRECKKCRALSYGTAAPGTCPAGGVHDPFVDDHGLVKNDPTAPGQSGWRRCTQCDSLFYGPHQAASRCPDGGTHVAGTDNYTMITDTTVLANPYWYRCTKCETLVREWYNVHAPWTVSSACPVGGRHTPDTNNMYVVPSFWAIRTLQAEAHPDLRRAASEVWPGGSSTPWLSWYDQTSAYVTLQVRPFASGDSHIRVDWINESGTWVDFSHAGFETGSFDYPFNLLSEGVGAVASGGYLYIKFSYSPVPAHITKPMRIRAHGGPALIGRTP